MVSPLRLSSSDPGTPPSTATCSYTGTPPGMPTGETPEITSDDFGQGRRISARDVGQLSQVNLGPRN